MQVRVNHLDTGHTRDDLAAAIGPGLDSIAFPKAESAAQIRELDVIIRELELKGGVRPGTALLFPQIETARGVLRCEDIAGASTPHRRHGGWRRGLYPRHGRRPHP